MGEVRLNGLAYVYANRDVKVHCENVIDKFASKSRREHRNFIVHVSFVIAKADIP
jgi:hypothetical protein